MNRLIYFLFLFILSFHLDAKDKSICLKSYDYKRPAHIDPKIWQTVKPFFLPIDHPIQSQLNKLFKARRVTLNESSLEKAHFKNTKPTKYSHIYASPHSKIKGYFFKMYTDEQHLEVPDYHLWIRRIEGAKSLKRAIENHGFQDYFVVPEKWLYPLPEYPAPPLDYERKNFILIAEEIPIYHGGANTSLWKSHFVTPKLLDALFILIRDEGLSDSVFPFNIPFSKVDMRIAFIDTEHHHEGHNRYHHLTPFLSKEMQLYWQKLISQGGP